MSQKSEWLTEAMSALIAQQPFFAVYLIDQMKIVETNKFPTAATDGKTIFVNPDFFKGLSIQERMFVLAHEVMHGIMQHMQRSKLYKDRGLGPDLKPFSHMRYNKAGDYVINPLLCDSNVGKMPVGALHHPDFTGNDLVDEVYLKVPEDDDDQEFDIHLDPPDGTPPPSDAEVKRALKSAANAAKAQGKLPAGLERLVDGLVEPQANWKELLRQHLEGGLGRDTTTWSRPNRRRMATEPHVYMPGYQGFRSGKVGVVIDTSGSISDQELQVFLSETAGILEHGKPERCLVLWTDAEVAGVDEVKEPHELLNLTPKGGGGTHMPAGIERAVTELGADQTTVVVLTDMYTDFGDDPGVDVIWVSTTKDREAPYGTTIFANIDPTNH